MAVIKLLQRLGLAERARQFSDVDRRGICAMIDAGMSDQSIHHIFGYTAVEIASARAGDLLIGKVQDVLLCKVRICSKDLQQTA